MNHLPPGSHDISQNIQIEVQVLTQVNKFKYLRSTDANINRLDAELNARTSNASKAEEANLAQQKTSP